MIAISVATFCTPVPAADLVPLKGKTIRVVIGSSAGGVGDAVARLFFKSMAEALPDSTLRLQNLQGAGGARAVKEVQEARAGAITLGFIGHGPLYTQMMTPEKSPFGRLALKWIGSFMIGQRVIVARRGLGLRALTDLKAQTTQVKIGAGEIQDPSTIETYMLNALLGLRLKVVPGIDDAQLLSMVLAGDLDMAMAGSTGLSEQLRSGALIPLLKSTSDSGTDFLRDVPSISDLAAEPSARDLVAMMQTLVRVRNIVVAAPTTDDPTIAALRAAFDQVAADTAFRAQTDKFDVGHPTSGQALEESLDGTSGFAGGRLLFLGETAKFYFDCGARMSDAMATSCSR